MKITGIKKRIKRIDHLVQKSLLPPVNNDNYLLHLRLADQDQTVLKIFFRKIVSIL